MNLKVKKLSPYAYLPQRAHESDAGLDLFCYESNHVYSFSRIIVRTGIAVEIPQGYAGFVQPRSGLAKERGITVLNTPGLIDSGYRGEIKVILYNSSHQIYTANPGTKIAQLVIVPITLFDVEEVKELSSSERGKKGFGSTGYNRKQISADEMVEGNEVDIDIPHDYLTLKEEDKHGRN